jgi:hypothetical protein
MDAGREKFLDFAEEEDIQIPRTRHVPRAFAYQPLPCRASLAAIPGFVLRLRRCPCLPRRNLWKLKSSNYYLCRPFWTNVELINGPAAACSMYSTIWNAGHWIGPIMVHIDTHAVQKFFELALHTPWRLPKNLATKHIV